LLEKKGIKMQEIKDDALVLEVGSGSSPWHRSDVLLDRFYIDETGQRGGGEIFIDRRPMVVAAGERLPFKDKAFDFVYCCHVVEHAVDIASMLDEMSRVAKAGFIECPNPLLERILDQEQHNWYITNSGGQLLIAPKTPANNVTTREDHFYFRLLSDHFIVRHHWDRFVTRLSWTGNIRYELCNDVSRVFASQPISSNLAQEVQDSLAGVLAKARADVRKDRLVSAVKSSKALGPLIKVAKYLQKWRRMKREPRLSPERFLSMLACPKCKSDLQRHDGRYRCIGCAQEFPDSDGVSVLL